MSTYKEIVGKKIKKVTSDPSDSVDGQMWYNSTTGSIRGLAIVSAWASSGSMITARGYGAANGTQTASLYTGGLEPGGTYYSNTEEYNGSGWSTGGALPTQNYAAGSAGTQTAALFFGGSNNPGGITVNTYTYNGSSWTATPNSLNLGRDYICGTGTQTSALAYCGRVTSPSLAAVTNFEEWNGSSWTALTAAPTAVALTMGNGPETAAFFASGGTNNGGPPYLSTTQEFNGSTLSAGGNVNTGRSAGGAAGDSSAGLIFGGDVGGTSQTKTETYDGTSFSEIADMSTAMRGMGNGSGATNVAAVASASYGPPALGTTEEFTSSTNVITAAAWASGGNLNTARNATAASGTQTAALCAAGQEGPGSTNPSAKTEEYDGTSWSEQNDLGTARFYISGSGIQTASLAVAGRTGPGPNFAKTLVEEYDGSSWSEQNDIPTAANGMMGAGTQTAAVHFGGISSPGGSSLTGTYEYDGTNWTTGGSLPTGAKYGMGVGTQTAVLHAGGGAADSFYYNGTSWSDQSSSLLLQNNPVYMHYGGMSGTQTAALLAGGGNPSSGAASALTQGWDGSVWFSQPSLGTARFYGAQGGAGTSTAGIAFSGQAAAPPYANLTATEEFTPESTAGNVKDFTTS